MAKHPTPTRPGYYWAKWRIASEGTRNGDELTRDAAWEIVQVNDNNGAPGSGEELSVAVAGVETTQWIDQFVWGPHVADLEYREAAPVEKRFHDFKPADVVVPDDYGATARALRALVNEQRTAGRLLRLTLGPDDVDENERVRYTRELIMYSTVVLYRDTRGVRIKKYGVPLSQCLAGLE